MTILYVLLVAWLLALYLAYLGRGLWSWVVPLAVLFGWWAKSGIESPMLFAVLAVPFVLLALLFGLAPLRQKLVSRHLMRFLAPIFPRMSDTEKTALEAGTVWWDAELFSGAPDWAKLVEFHPKALSEKERKFLEGPC